MCIALRQWLNVALPFQGPQEQKMPASLEAARDSSDVDAWATGICTFAQFHHRIDDFAVILDVTMQHLEQ